MLLKFTTEEQKETQANECHRPTHTKTKGKGQPKNAAQPTPPKAEPKPPEQNKGGKGVGKVARTFWGQGEC